MSTIELDCPPGPTRPDNLLPHVIKDTGLEVEDFTITSKVFGNWEFTLKKEKQDTYEKCKNVIEERIKDLYKIGRIRYGSW